MRKDERGRFPARHYASVDPGLVGLEAFGHPAVKAWHRWLLEEYRPRYRVALVTPCSNVKPYTRSPASRKVRGVLRRLGLWDGQRPRGLEWLYLSDLLALVPYERAEHHPACCYELHPDELLASKRHYPLLVETLRAAVERLAGEGLLEHVILFLPKKHMRIWGDARRGARHWPRETTVKYTIFSTKSLEETLRRVVLR